MEQGRASRFMYGGNWQCSERPLVVLCWGIFLSKSGELLGIASAETGFASRRFALSNAGVVRYARLSAWGTQVKDNQSSLAGGLNRFQTTRWSIVLVSAQSQAPGYKEALADLCKLYWYPLYAYVRHRGNSSEDAQDLVQGFFLHLIEYKTLSRVDRSKGKFRSFLLASLQNFLANEADRARAVLNEAGRRSSSISTSKKPRTATGLNRSKS